MDLMAHKPVNGELKAVQIPRSIFDRHRVGRSVGWSVTLLKFVPKRYLTSLISPDHPYAINAVLYKAMFYFHTPFLFQKFKNKLLNCRLFSWDLVTINEVYLSASISKTEERSFCIFISTKQKYDLTCSKPFHESLDSFISHSKPEMEDERIEKCCLISFDHHGRRPYLANGGKSSISSLYDDESNPISALCSLCVSYFASYLSISTIKS